MKRYNCPGGLIFLAWLAIMLTLSLLLATSAAGVLLCALVALAGCGWTAEFVWKYFHNQGVRYK